MSSYKKYDIAAYVWPAYTGDEKRTRIFWNEGIGEWQSVKNAANIKKYTGNYQNPEYLWDRKPLWGYVNEADPYIMEMQIEAATDHGVNVFIYDWYWYDRRPFLENCLNDGFLKAKNHNKMKFYLMWANHSVNNTWDIRNSYDQNNIIWDGAVDRKEFEIICKRIIEKYFKHPYFPHISVGWDNNPRFYEFRPGIVKNNTPENFEKALVKAKGYIDLHQNQPNLITINSWNEWTETSYLMPDNLYGYGYLESVKKVFLET